MKYVRLSLNELEELEKEFVDFLVINGITADDWVSIKENEPLNAEEIINQFSEVVWEGILRSTRYLKKVEDQNIYLFKCESDEIHLKRLTKIDSKTMLEETKKKYQKVRELELFEMIQSGCTICDGGDYEQLS